MPLPVIRRTLDALRLDGTIHPFELLWSMFWVIAILGAAWTILWGLAGREYLRLTSSHLDLIATVFGVAYKRRSTPLGEVRKLRFVPSFRQGRSYRESEIRYEDAKGSAKLGAGLDDAEALALIDQLLEKHPFPKRDKSLEYIDLNG